MSLFVSTLRSSVPLQVKQKHLKTKKTVKEKNFVRVREHAAGQHAAAGAQFTCFTGTKGQILMQKALQQEQERMLTYADKC
jgi:hypothetical protein